MFSICPSIILHSHTKQLADFLEAVTELRNDIPLEHLATPSPAPCPHLVLCLHILSLGNQQPSFSRDISLALMEVSCTGNQTLFGLLGLTASDEHQIGRFSPHQVLTPAVWCLLSSSLAHRHLSSSLACWEQCVCEYWCISFCTNCLKCFCV